MLLWQNKNNFMTNPFIILTNMYINNLIYFGHLYMAKLNEKNVICCNSSNINIQETTEMLLQSLKSTVNFVTLCSPIEFTLLVSLGPNSFSKFF